LFLQAGPLCTVKIPKDKGSGKQRSFGFVTYRDSCSVPYACELFNQLSLFKRPIYCKPQNADRNSRGGSSPSQQPQSPQSTTPQTPGGVDQWSRAPNDSFSTPTAPNHPMANLPSPVFDTSRNGDQRGGGRSHSGSSDSSRRDSFDSRRGSSGGHDRRDSRGYEPSPRRDDHMQPQYNRQSSSSGFNQQGQQQGQYPPSLDQVQSPLFMQAAINQAIQNSLEQQGPYVQQQGNYGPSRRDDNRGRDNRRQRPY